MTLFLCISLCTFCRVSYFSSWSTLAPPCWRRTGRRLLRQLFCLPPVIADDTGDFCEFVIACARDGANVKIDAEAGGLSWSRHRCRQCKQA